MPSIRIGFSSEFVLRNELVGIGSTATSSRLDVAGQIRSENTAGSGGVSTFREYQGFSQTQAEISNEVLIDNGDCGPFSSLTGEIKITGETTVSSGSTVEVGKTKTLTVTDRFAVPLGETNNRDNAPEAGTTRFNQDFGTLEFFDGVSWKTVNSYARGGAAGRMLTGCGVNPSNTNIIQSININTFGNSEFFGDLNESKSNVTAVSSATRGIWAGGAYQRTIDYVTIASGGTGADFGNLSTANRGYLSGASSSTRGVFGGGYTTSPSPATVDVIDYIEIGTLGDALDFGNLFTGRYSAAAVSNGVRAVWGGGMTPPIKSLIDYVTITSKGDAIKFGDLTVERRMMAESACSNNIRGIFAGGQQPVLLSIMDYITIATEGNAVYFGDLTEARTRSVSGSTNTRGLWAGGLNPNASNVIDYVNITSTGNAQDFGDLYMGTGAAGGCSDSHGGLGGF
jgi:hypothetical protein